MEWEVVELKGYAYFADRGYRIFVPLICGIGYDFIAAKGDELIRVNVKLAGLKDKSNPSSWSITLASGAISSGSKSDKVKCDVFLAYLPNKERFIELPGTFFDTGNSRCRRIPKELLLS